MKSKNVQKAVKTKYENGDGPSQIYRDLAEVVSLQTIKLWIKMVNNTGSINLSSPPGRPRTARTKDSRCR
jgi:transposase